MPNAGNTDQDSMLLLLAAAQQVWQAQEGVSMPQRHLMEMLGEAPARTEGWVTLPELAHRRHEKAKAVLDDLAGLTPRGIVERRENPPAYRLTDDGVDLLARIERRDEDMPLLRRLPEIIARRHRRPAAEMGEVQAKLQRSILEILSAGPAIRADLMKATGAAESPLQYALWILREKGRIWNVKQGVWALREESCPLSQSKEGAA